MHPCLNNHQEIYRKRKKGGGLTQTKKRTSQENETLTSHVYLYIFSSQNTFSIVRSAYDNDT